MSVYYCYLVAKSCPTLMTPCSVTPKISVLLSQCWGEGADQNPNPLFYSHFYWTPEKLVCAGASEVSMCPASQGKPSKSQGASCTAGYPLPFLETRGLPASPGDLLFSEHRVREAWGEVELCWPAAELAQLSLVEGPGFPPHLSPCSQKTRQ